jgi:release factor glutamine methyltransferase
MTGPDYSFQSALAELRSGFVAATDKPDETVEKTTRSLWHFAAGERISTRSDSRMLPTLDVSQVMQLRALIQRRLQGEPLAYLLGMQEFLGVELIAAPGALIPRRETELLARAAIQRLAVLKLRVPVPQILDLCTGSANVAVVLALNAPTAMVVATDLEAQALEVAAKNLALHGLSARVQLFRGDLFGALPPRPALFDLISCNPPYLTSAHANDMPREIAAGEPVAAFDGGPYGLSIVLRLIREAPQFLAPGAWLCFEIGAGQHKLVESRLRQFAGYGQIEHVADENAVPRAYVAQWQG